MFPVGKADMAFDAFLAARIRDALGRKKNIEEKKMFGGIGFMLNGNMMFGVWKDSLIGRLGPDEGDDALLEPHVRRVHDCSFNLTTSLNSAATLPKCVNLDSTRSPGSTETKRTAEPGITHCPERSDSPCLTKWLINHRSEVIGPPIISAPTPEAANSPFLKRATPSMSQSRFVGLILFSPTTRQACRPLEQMSSCDEGWPNHQS